MKNEGPILKKASLCSGSREVIRGDVCSGISSEVKPSANARSRCWTSPNMSEKACLINNDTMLVHCDWYHLLGGHTDMSDHRPRRRDTGVQGDDPDVERVMAERGLQHQFKTPRRINNPPSTAPLSAHIELCVGMSAVSWLTIGSATLPQGSR